jgi:predicted SnoaL-like aldol condensation-catalyzing enzyme
MSSSLNKAVVRELVERAYSGEVDRLDGLVAPDYLDHSRWGDREGLRRVIVDFKAAYPGIEFSVRDIVGEGDKVAARIRCTCRDHPGESGHEKVIHSIAIFRLANGKVVEHWGHSDSFF